MFCDELYAVGSHSQRKPYIIVILFNICININRRIEMEINMDLSFFTQEKEIVEFYIVRIEGDPVV